MPTRCRFLWLSLVAALFASPTPAFAQGAPPIIEPAVNQALIVPRGANQFEVRQFETQMAPYTKEETYTVEKPVERKVLNPATNREEVQTVTVTETRVRTVSGFRQVLVQRAIPVSLDQVTAREVRGESIAREALPEKLREPTLALVESRSQRLPEDYAILFDPETLVLTIDYEAIRLAPNLPVPNPPAPKSPDAPADATAQLPAAPPLFRLASVDEKNLLVLRATRTEQRDVTRYQIVTTKIERNGEQLEVQQVVPVRTTEQIELSAATRFRLENVRGKSLDGKDLGETHLQALRRRELPVVVSRDGQNIDPFWLRNIRPKMLALVVPADDAFLDRPGGVPPPRAPGQPLPGPAPTRPASP